MDDLQLRVAAPFLSELGANPDPESTNRNDVPRSAQRPGVFISPHCARWTAQGDILVVDWLLEGRLTRLAQRPSPGSRQSAPGK